MITRHPAPVGKCLGVLFLFVASCYLSGVEAMGINYGTLGDNLPSPPEVVQLLKTTSVEKVKLYAANSTILSAFANSGYDVIVGVENDLLQQMAMSENYTAQWVTDNVVPYYPATNIILVSVGNEILTSDPNASSSLVAAMLHMQTALTNAKLDMIKVSTPHSFAVLNSSSPPSAGTFLPEYSSSVFVPLLSFLAATGSPFMINAYPYFAYSDTAFNSIEYALFETNIGVNDPATGLTYFNLFDAQIDATYCAMGRLGFYNVTVIVSETGWPSLGDPTEKGANLTNAQTYNSNLIQHIAAKTGTPLKPGVAIDTYIFSLFNEDMKPGPTSERNFGLFWPNQSIVYDVGIQTNTTPSAPISNTSPAPTAAPILAPITAPVPVSPSPPAPVLPPPSPPSPPSPPPPPYPGLPTAPAAPISPPAAPITPPAAPTTPPAVVISPPPAPISPLPATSTPPPVPSTSPPPAPTSLPPPAPPVVTPPSPVTAPPPPSFFSPPAVPPSTDPTFPPPPAQPAITFPPPPAPVVSPPAPVSPPPPPPIVLPPYPPIYPSPPPPAPVSALPPGSPPTPVVVPPGTLGPSGSPPAPVVPVTPGGPSGPNTWCVAKPAVPDPQLMDALNFACGEGGADCSPIQLGQPCYDPNTVFSHASYAFNSYYAANGRNSWDCYFNNSSVVTQTNPSYVGCTYA